MGRCYGRERVGGASMCDPMTAGDSASASKLRQDLEANPRSTKTSGPSAGRCQASPSAPSNLATATASKRIPNAADAGKKPHHFFCISSRVGLGSKWGASETARSSLPPFTFSPRLSPSDSGSVREGPTETARRRDLGKRLGAPIHAALGQKPPCVPITGKWQPTTHDLDSKSPP
jgi:hypothetical protein